MSALANFIRDHMPVRQSTSERREKNAFNLGRDAGLLDASNMIRDRLNNPTG